MKNWILALVVGHAACGLAQERKPTLHLGIFVDTYYAFDANQPNRDRLYTTLPTRHNEFALNLAMIEARVASGEVRAHLALQAGTSVYANYSTELRDPTKSGAQLADLLQNVQEANVGYKVSDSLWVDAGIFLSHIGSESFISKENWNYTRSLIADFSPYYQAGVRLSYDSGNSWSFQVHVLNGWQNLIETNTDKSLGTQVVFHPTDRFSVTHNALVGREADLRVFQDLILKYRVFDFWEASITVDFGVQRRPFGFATWYGTSLQNRFKIDDKTHLSLRLENYADPDGVIVPTTTASNFQAVGASVNLDRKLSPELLWRNELRWLNARDAIFPSNSGSSTQTAFGITSLSFSF